MSTETSLAQASKVKAHISMLAVRENEEAAQLFLASALHAACAPSKVRNDLRLALEELFINVAAYAYNPNVGMLELNVEADGEEGSFTISLSDKGSEFNPFEKPDPTKPASIEEATIGGLGILLVKRLMDECSYERIDDTNEVTVTKRWQPESEQANKQANAEQVGQQSAKQAAHQPEAEVAQQPSNA